MTRTLATGLCDGASHEQCAYIEGSEWLILHMSVDVSTDLLVIVRSGMWLHSPFSVVTESFVSAHAKYHFTKV